MERWRKLKGRRMDADERERKKEARMVHKRSEFAQKVRGIRAKLYHEKRFKEKAAMKKRADRAERALGEHPSLDWH